MKIRGSSPREEDDFLVEAFSAKTDFSRVFLMHEMGFSKNRQIMDFNRIFHHKPSILGYPHFARQTMSCHGSLGCSQFVWDEMLLASPKLWGECQRICKERLLRYGLVNSFQADCSAIV